MGEVLESRSYGDGTKGRGLETGSGKAIIVYSTPTPSIPFTPIAEALRKDKEGEEKRKNEINFPALDATNYLHASDNKTFVRGTAEIVKDIISMTRALSEKEEDNTGITRPKLPLTPTPEQGFELSEIGRHPLTNLNFHPRLSLRIYVQPTSPPPNNFRPLPSSWRSEHKKKWEKFCQQMKEEGWRIIS